MFLRVVGTCVLLGILGLSCCSPWEIVESREESGRAFKSVISVEVLI